MKVQFNLSIGLVGAIRQETIECPDDYTETYIQDQLDVWADGYIDTFFQVLEDPSGFRPASGSDGPVLDQLGPHVEGK